MPDRPLTILQLTHEGHGAGSTMMIASLSRQLAGRGHRVLVGCRAGSVLARMVGDAGLQHVPLEFGRLAPLARDLDALMTRERVDLVNSHGTGDRRALTWLRWRRRLGRPFVVTRHTMPLTSPAELVAVGLSADRTIAVSHAVARALRRRLYPAGRLRVVPNGIELARVDAAPSEEDMAAARAARTSTCCCGDSPPSSGPWSLPASELKPIPSCEASSAPFQGVIAWCTCRSRTAHSRFPVWPWSRRCRRASRGFLSRCSRRWRWGCRSSHPMPVGTRT